MALNLPTSDGGHRMPIIKYDARAGRIFRVDRSDASGSWVSDPVELPQASFQAIFDLENIETGWLHFPTGGAPDIRTAKVGTALPDRPTDKHRTGFRILLKLGKASGGDLREMAANAKVSIDGMDLLHDAYMAGKDAHPGELPVVRLAGTKPITTQGKNNGQPVSSTNFLPLWEIVKWAPRPPELQPGYDVTKAVEPQQQQAAAAPPAPPPPPPAAEPAKQLASVDDDF